MEDGRNRPDGAEFVERFRLADGDERHRHEHPQSRHLSVAVLDAVQVQDRQRIGGDQAVQGQYLGCARVRVVREAVAGVRVRVRNREVTTAETSGGGMTTTYGNLVQRQYLVLLTTAPRNINIHSVNVSLRSVLLTLLVMQNRAWTKGVRPLSWILTLVPNVAADFRRSDDS